MFTLPVKFHPCRIRWPTMTCIPGFRNLAETAHGHGAKIAVQLFHAGRETAKVFKPLRKQALAPSSIPDDPYFQGSHRAMTEDEIQEVIRAFGQAAGRAGKPGWTRFRSTGPTPIC